MLNWQRIADVAIDQYHALQSRGELATFLALAASLCPSAIVEVGTHDGGTAWAMSHLPGVRKIVTVDKNDHPAQQAKLADMPSVAPVVRVLGDSAAPGTIAAAYRHLPQGADLVLIDADHTYDGAMADWRAYEPLVNAGGLLAFHDIAWADHELLEVARVWKEVRAEHPGRTTEIVDEHGTCGIGIVWL